MFFMSRSVVMSQVHICYVLRHDARECYGVNRLSFRRDGHRPTDAATCLRRRACLTLSPAWKLLMLILLRAKYFTVHITCSRVRLCHEQILHLLGDVYRYGVAVG